MGNWPEPDTLWGWELARKCVRKWMCGRDGGKADGLICLPFLGLNTRWLPVEQSFWHPQLCCPWKEAAQKGHSLTWEKRRKEREEKSRGHLQVRAIPRRAKVQLWALTPPHSTHGFNLLAPGGLPRLFADIWAPIGTRHFSQSALLWGHGREQKKVSTCDPRDNEKRIFVTSASQRPPPVGPPPPPTLHRLWTTHLSHPQRLSHICKSIISLNGSPRISHRGNITGLIRWNSFLVPPVWQPQLTPRMKAFCHRTDSAYHKGAED